jgi:hypothetical protein
MMTDSEVIALARSGIPHRDIVAASGRTLADIQTIIGVHLDEVRISRLQDAETARTLSAERIGRYIAALELNALTGDVEAITAAVRLEAQLARLLGLDRAPAMTRATTAIVVDLVE